MAPDPQTEELRRAQAAVAREEAERAERAADPEATHEHARRADRAAYLRAKLEERAAAEDDTNRGD